MVLPVRSLFALLALLTLTSASPTVRRRHARHGKRSSCATPTDAAVQVGPDGNVVLAVGVDGQQTGEGHWETYTTSKWIDDAAGVTTTPPTTDAGSTLTTAAFAAVTTTPSDATNPIDTFVTASSSSSEDDVSLGLSLSLGLGTSPSTTSSSAASSASSSATPSASSSASSPATSGATNTSGASTGKHVFAHFMVGIVSTYAQSDWEADMRLAKSKGITGFALNIGVDPYTQTQLDLGYAAAEAVGDFNVFISFDFNWYGTSQVGDVATMLKRYMDHPAQLQIDGKPFVSTFIGDGFDWSAVASQVGKELFAVPFWQPSQEHVDNSGVKGLFSWDAWPGQIDNQPVLAAMSADRDHEYINMLSAVDKKYMAPVSPWFYTHFGKEVSYSKNWLFYSESLWKDRWDQVLKMSSQLDFLEIVTWNDYGESHYIGPYDTPHTDDGSSKWAAGLDHTPMLDFAVPYIKAFKQGKTEPVIEQDMLVYWYRPHLKSATCDSSDNCGSKPTGWDMVEDVVFVATMTQGGATFSVGSGANAAVTQQVPAGVNVYKFPMGVGQQQFAFQGAGGKTGTSMPNITISDGCWNGIYNFNFHSGSIVL